MPGSLFEWSTIDHAVHGVTPTSISTAATTPISDTIIKVFSIPTATALRSTAAAADVAATTTAAAAAAIPTTATTGIDLCCRRSSRTDWSGSWIV